MYKQLYVSDGKCYEFCRWIFKYLSYWLKSIKWLKLVIWRIILAIIKNIRKYSLKNNVNIVH